MPTQKNTFMHEVKSDNWYKMISKQGERSRLSPARRLSEKLRFSAKWAYFYLTENLDQKTGLGR